MTDFEQHWSSLTDRILRLWPETDSGSLARLDGSKGAFIGYLARVHELTVLEAVEVVDNWLLATAPAPARLLAAE